MDVNDKTPKLYLSRRNLLSLLSKLDRQADGEETLCTIVKYRQDGKTAYNQTMNTIVVIGVEDADYYGAQNRAAGEIHPSDEKNLEKPDTGTYVGIGLH